MPIQTIPGVDLDALTGNAPAPPTAATDEVATQATSLVQAAVVSGGDPAAKLSGRDMLGPELQEKARAAAVKGLPMLIADPNELAEFGNQALTDINAAAQKLFHLFLGEDHVKIPELTADTQSLEAEVRGFRDKHKGHDGKFDENAESARKFFGKIRDKVNKSRDWFEVLVSDARGLEHRMDVIVAGMETKRTQLVRNVQICNELLDVNERAILNLVFVIAVHEYLEDEARAAIEAIVIDESDPDVRTKREQRDVIVTLLQQIEVRTSEFKQRLFVAWATSPQIRNIRTLNYGLGQRLALIINITIPVFKLTVAQWAMAIEADQGADMTKAATEFNNSTLQEFAGTSAAMVPKIAEIIQTPSTSPETVMAMANSLLEQSAAFVNAYRSGQQQRGAVEAAIVNAQGALAKDADQRAGEMLALATAAAQPALELPASIDLPEVITNRAAEAVAVTAA